MKQHILHTSITFTAIKSMLHQLLKLNLNPLYLAKRVLLTKKKFLRCEEQKKDVAFDKSTYWISIRIIIAHLQKPLRPG